MTNMTMNEFEYRSMVKAQALPHPRACYIYGEDMVERSVAVLMRKNQEIREHPVPVVLNLDLKVLALLGELGHSLDMTQWGYGPEDTRKCFAGWIVHAAGEPGFELARTIPPAVAAYRIAEASGSPVRFDMFYLLSRIAMKEIEHRAAKAAERVTA